MSFKCCGISFLGKSKSNSSNKISQNDENKKTDETEPSDDEAIISSILQKSTNKIANSLVLNDILLPAMSSFIPNIDEDDNESENKPTSSKELEPEELEEKLDKNVLLKKGAILEAVELNDNSIISKLEQKHLKLFLDQDINKIRAAKRQFEDKKFLRTISSIVNKENFNKSELFISLKSRLFASKSSDLQKLILWSRTKVNYKKMKLI